MDTLRIVYMLVVPQSKFFFKSYLKVSGDGTREESQMSESKHKYLAQTHKPIYCSFHKQDEPKHQEKQR